MRSHPLAITRIHCANPQIKSTANPLNGTWIPDELLFVSTESAKTLVICHPLNSSLCEFTCECPYNAFRIPLDNPGTCTRTLQNSRNRLAIILFINIALHIQQPRTEIIITYMGPCPHRGSQSTFTYLSVFGVWEEMGGNPCKHGENTHGRI